MFGNIKKIAAALHRDERGDMAQIVLAVALIVIPLLLMILAFGQQIAKWFKTNNDSLKGPATKKLPTL